MDNRVKAHLMVQAASRQVQIPSYQLTKHYTANGQGFLSETPYLDRKQHRARKAGDGSNE